MKPISEREAHLKICPFGVGVKKYPDSEETYCNTRGCMAWNEILPHTERENHSGGAAVITELAVKTNRPVFKSGPNSSTGYIFVESAGVCERLQNKEV